MARFKKSFNNPFSFSDFTSNSSDLYDYTMNNLMDNFYDSATNQSTDGVFKAVCLSGMVDEDNTGAGTGTNSGELQGKYVFIAVRPLAPIGNMLPDPRQFDDPASINDCITLHAQTFLARSDFEFTTHLPIKFGQVVNCYFEKGSIENSDFRGLRFQEPHGVTVEDSFVLMGAKTGVQTQRAAFVNGNVVLVGDFGGAENIGAIDNVIKKFAQELDGWGGSPGGVGIDPPAAPGLFTTHVESELSFWQEGKRKESSRDPMYSKLKMYWDNVHKSSWTPSGTPWSAAFISWCLDAPNMSHINFKGASSHYKYSENVIEGKSPGWKAYSLMKGVPTPLHLGDVIVKPRGKPAAPNQDEFYYSHGDVVYKIENNVAYLAGGNVGPNSAKTVLKIDLDSNNLPVKIPIERNGTYMIILKKES